MTITLDQAQAADNHLILHTYARLPHLFVSGHGVYLTDESGQDYLDLLSGIGCSALGYAHPALTKAIADQAATLLHTSNLFHHPLTAPLAMRLTEISGMDRVFFCNSGTEAWEAALKLARAAAPHAGLGIRFIALTHAFHGRTMGSVATTEKLAYRQPFAPLIPGVEFVPFNDIAALRAAFSKEICAILVEPIQGEGGIHPLSQEFFQAARDLCDSTGALLIADEIQCGFGRTGKWFAYQHFGIQPDVTTIAKPLAGGLPIGAMLCTEKAAAAITPGMHGTTFGGNPLACAAAIAVIDEIKSTHLLQHITDTGTYFLTQLQTLKLKHDCIAEVRGKGLMIGVELASPDLATQALNQMLARHIILNRTAETVLRFLPPYILERAHIDHAITALDEILTLIASPVGVR